MNLPEFYNAINGNYNEIQKNLISDEIIEELVLDFPGDNSFTLLKESFTAGDVKAAFIAAHTLKGGSASLGFTCLADPVAAVTETLRGNTMPSADEMTEIESQYNKVIEAIRLYK